VLGIGSAADLVVAIGLCGGCSRYLRRAHAGHERIAHVEYAIGKAGIGMQRHDLTEYAAARRLGAASEFVV
jgi:hypothetical protein